MEEVRMSIRNRRGYTYVLQLALLVVFASTGWAADTSSIFGAVRDQTGAFIPDVDITVTNVGTNRSESVKSEANGEYLVVDLSSGTYIVSAEKPGFKSFRQEQVVLLVEQQLRVDVNLSLGSVSETVTVTGQPSQVDTRSGTLKDVVTGTQIVELPLNGRNTLQLIALQAGVQPTSAQYFQQIFTAPTAQFFSISGAPGNYTDYMLDGSDHNDSYTNAPLPVPNSDALQEFSVQTNNFSAEYGHSAGGIVDMIIKSGSNAFHGSLFEYLRNGDLNGDNYFATSNDGLHRNQFGGTIGGPLIKNRTFFFFSYQGTRTRAMPSDNIAFVPTAAQRTGDLSGLPPVTNPETGQPFPNNQIPVDPAIQKVLAQIPLPNGPNGQLSYVTHTDDNIYEVVARVDHNLTSKDKLFGSIFLQPDVTPPTGDTSNLIAITTGLAYHTYTGSLGESHLFSPNLFNDFRAAATRIRAEITPNTAMETFQYFGVNIPQVVPVNIFEFDTPFFTISNGRYSSSRNAFNYADTLSWVKGRHELKFGADIIRNQDNHEEDFLSNGAFTFGQERTGSPYGDLLLGLPTTFEQINPLHTELRRTLPMFFAQDTFRVSRELTLSFGARYEPYVNWRELRNQQLIFSPGSQSTTYPNLPPGLLAAGDPGAPINGMPDDYRRLAPRLGFAYSPFGNGNTSIRGGYGISYDTLTGLNYPCLVSGPPFTVSAVVSDPTSFENPYAGQTDPFPAPNPAPPSFPLPPPLGTVHSLDANIRTPYIQEWNATVEHQLPSQFVLRAAYVGSKGTDLYRGRDYNAAMFIPGVDASGNPLSTIANVNARRPLQGYQRVYVLTSDGDSHLNSMQLTLERRFQRGLTLNVNYTLQKSTDDAPQTGESAHEGALRDPYHPDDWGPSDFDRTHRLVSSFVWQLPQPFANQRALKLLLGGWETTGIFTIQSGLPFTVTSGGDPSLSGGGSPAFADLSGDPQRPSGVNPVDEWFNTAAFQNAATGTFGNIGRNSLRGPRSVDLDFGLLRDFRLTEKVKLQFRSEYFNLFNHPNFGLPNASLGNPASFGEITTASDPRIIQFALRLGF
jgi:hypothetical protein